MGQIMAFDNTEPRATSIQPDARAAPTDVKALLAGLSPEKRALLERRLQQGKKAKEIDPSLETPTIPRRPEMDSAPLSFAQELLWLVDQLNPSGAYAYNLSRLFRVEGSLDVEVLRRTIEAIVARHEILRTTISTQAGEPRQTINPPPKVDLAFVDLSSRERAERDSERDSEALRMLEQESDRPFDLARDLMLRAMLIRLDDRRYYFAIFLHHIASDGLSKGILFKELSEFYAAFSACRAPQLPELPIQYADYAVWQRQRLTGERYERLIAYWKQKLTGAPGLLELPTDRPRPREQSFRGSNIRRLVAPALLTGLKELSRERKATLFMVLLAAYNAWLCRYTGQTDLLVGTPIANREHHEVAGLMGFFINTLVLRNDLSDDPTFRTLIDRVRETSLEAYEHQEMPFEKLVMEVKPNRDTSFSPLIQSLFSLGHMGNAQLQDVALTFPGLKFTLLPLSRRSAKFDLTFALTAGTDWLALGCEYCTDLFDASTIERMLHHFEILVQGAIDDPDQRVSQLPILSPAERQQVLVDWNDTRRDLPTGATIPQQFRAQAARAPGAIAIVAGEMQLTYGELDARSDRLARYLRGRGVQSGVHVAICAGRSLEMAIAIMGTLKAGGVCIPLDPDYPLDRLTFMIQDAQAPLLLTLATLRSQLPENAAEVLCLDTDGSALAEPSENYQAWEVKPEQPAYVFYTSGSTGIPKGVVLSHRGLINHSLAAIDLYGLTKDDRVLQFASLSFDMSLEELLPALCIGATVVFRPDGETLAGASFSRWIEQERISVLDLPTAFWHEWVLELSVKQEAAPSELRMVIVGGEKALAQTYATWMQHGGDRIRWVNTYGPTETTVIATTYEPAGRALTPTDTEDPPIGRPIQNTQIYILDSHLLPVPVGVSGEIYIGGDGLALGYLHRPDLTAQRFIPHPFSADSSARVYRTGDRGRWRADGVIQFLGRTDDQVKIRGFRIEPGEIEAALQRLPCVRQAAVVVAEDALGAKRLLAYVVPDTDPAASVQELRQHLGAMLPEYMIPTAFAVLPHLPLTANGKIDRQRLPVIDVASTSSEAAFAAPRTPAEESLARIWCEVLGLERVGIYEDFFLMGGDSLLALRLWNRVALVFGKTYPLNLIYRHRTIAQIASVLVPEIPGDLVVDAAVPATSASAAESQRPVLHCLDFAKFLVTLLDNVDIYPLETFEREKVENCSSIAEVAATYVERIRKREGPYRLLGFCGMGLVAFEMARQLQAQGQVVAQLILIDPRPARPVPHHDSINVKYFLKRTKYHLSRFRSLHPRLWPGYLGSGLSAFCMRLGRRIGIATRDRNVPEWWAARPRLRKALAEYTPPSYDGPVTIFVCQDKVDRLGIADLLWGIVALGGVDVRVIPGDHSTMLQEPYVQVFRRELRSLFACDLPPALLAAESSEGADPDLPG